MIKSFWAFDSLGACRDFTFCGLHFLAWFAFRRFRHLEKNSPMKKRDFDLGSHLVAFLEQVLWNVVDEGGFEPPASSLRGAFPTELLAQLWFDTV